MTFDLEVHRLLPASRQFAKLSCNGTNFLQRATLDWNSSLYLIYKLKLGYTRYNYNNNYYSVYICTMNLFLVRLYLNLKFFIKKLNLDKCLKGRALLWLYNSCPIYIGQALCVCMCFIYVKQFMLNLFNKVFSYLIYIWCLLAVFVFICLLDEIKVII